MIKNQNKMIEILYEAKRTKFYKSKMVKMNKCNIQNVYI